MKFNPEYDFIGAVCITLLVMYLLSILIF